MSTPPAGSPEPVSVVTVTYGPSESLGTFLDSVDASTRRPVDVVVVDNNDDGVPHPNVVEAAARPGVRLITGGGNVGYGRGVNAGVAETATSLVVAANPDIEFQPGAVDELLDAVARWPHAGSFGPRIYTPDGLPYPSARSFPSLGRGIGHALCGWWWPSNPWTRAYLNGQNLDAEREADWLSGACLLMRREAFDAVDGFDPAYFMYFEDTDLGWRLAQCGWQRVYVPTAAVTHVGGLSTAGVKPQMLKAHHRSATVWLRRRYPGARWAPVRLLMRLGLWARGQLAAR